MKTSSDEYLAKLTEIQNSVSTAYLMLPSQEPRFIIDSDSRKITVPDAFTFLGLKNDTNAETIYFEIDRYFDRVDLSKQTCVVQWNNGANSGIYTVDQMDITTVTGKLIFGWTIRNDVTAAAGDVAFSVRFYTIANNAYTYNFNTSHATLPISDTLDVANRITIPPSSVTQLETIAQQVQEDRQSAGLSEANAKISESNAKTSETNAKASESAAAGSAAQAASSATAALNSQNTAAESASAANTSATEAAASESSAAAKAAAASESANNSELSAQAAAGKATEAANSKSEAAASETAAAGSASAAATSATQAAGSAAAAAQSAQSAADELTAVNAAGTTQITNINAAATTQVQAVNTAGDAKIAAINALDVYTKTAANARFAGALVVTESGNPLTIYPDVTSGALASVKVSGLTTQSGSGTPSPTNIRPISGVGEYHSNGYYTDIVVTTNGVSKTYTIGPMNSPLYEGDTLTWSGGSTVDISRNKSAVVLDGVTIGRKFTSYGVHANGQKYCGIQLQIKAKYNSAKVCSHYKAGDWSDDNYHYYIPTIDNLIITDSMFTNIATANEFLAAQLTAGTPVVILYTALTPVTETVPISEPITNAAGDVTISAENTVAVTYNKSLIAAISQLQTAIAAGFMPFAYLNCTTNAGATVTAVSGTKVYSGVADNNGAVTLLIGAAGTYSVTATLNGKTSSAISVNVTQSGTVYTCKFPSLVLEIVSWAAGTDEQIAAMLDAAKAGTINLQTNGGWAVGDVRTIQISAFTGGGNVAHVAQSIDIAISSFADYNACGCVMQFDFKDELATHVRMNPSNTNYGGYGATEMKTTTLPALVNALPAWLKDRLLEFSVLASMGSQSSTIKTVTGNKLALRSEVEIFGTTTYTAAGEGYQTPYYTTSANRIKKRGHSGSGGYWWGRSPYPSSSGYFCYVDSSGGSYRDDASNARGVAPFGCI